MELNCPVKQYAWGKCGSKSLVAQLKQSSDKNFQIVENETYAELWMGTHPSGPALIKHSSQPLDEWVKENSSKLGETTVHIYGNELPFLFKILSVSMPLSIQVHPSKDQAVELHSKFPDVYKDANHKPEMAIALSNFEVLCGFRPIGDIRHFLQMIPELTHLIGDEKSSAFMDCTESEETECLARIFESLMKATGSEVRKYLDTFMIRAVTLDSNAQTDILYKLFERIHSYYPGDVGCFCIYFLNHEILPPGEAIFLDANQPHAYIYGDCVECMAGSDNVVRAALTTKLRDVAMLIKLLNYTSLGDSKRVHPYAENDHSMLYRTPAKEFAVCKVEVKPGFNYDLKCRSSASIFIVLRGHGSIDESELKRGQVFFVGANEVHKIGVPASARETLLLFQAFVNI